MGQDSIRRDERKEETMRESLLPFSEVPDPDPAKGEPEAHIIS